MQGVGSAYSADDNASNKGRLLAYSLLRATLGLNIAMHGLSRLWAGAGHFAAGLVVMFHGTPLPPVLVLMFGYSLPWLETTIGLLILVGLWTRYALASGALVILALTFGTTLRQNWDTAGLQLNYAFIFAALLSFLECNAFSFDGLLRKRAFSSTGR